MPATKRGGHLNLLINHLNGRLFNRLLKNDGRALYSAEQGKILSALWDRHPQTATELSQITGLANSTLTPMLKRLETEQGLITSVVAEDDKRKKLFDLTELGQEQKHVGEEVSDQLSEIFYSGFTDAEIDQLEDYLRRIVDNLTSAMEQTSK